MDKENDIAQVPLICYEMAAARYERIIKRLTITFCAIIAAGVVINRHPLH